MSITSYSSGINPRFAGASGSVYSRRKRRKINGVKGTCSTPGKTKSDFCKASATERTMARRSRAYRWHTPWYNNWCTTEKRR